MATLVEIMDALASQLTTDLSPHFTNLQVTGQMNFNPTPPSIDIYPGDPFFQPVAYGVEYAYFFTVRARVTTADSAGGQEQLLSLMDPAANTSLTDSIEGTYSIGGRTYDVTVEEGPSAFGIFNDPGSVENRTLGALWRVRVL